MSQYKKKICLIIDQNDDYAYLLCKTLYESNYFNFVTIIFREKNKSKISRFKKFFNKKTLVVTTIFPHKIQKLTKFLKNNKIELAFSLSWHNKIKKKFLNLFSIGIVNFHPSPLPLNRGCHSTFWGIYNNNSHGCTMHFMDENLDRGKLIDQSIFKNRDEYFAEYVFRRTRMLGIKLLRRNLKNFYTNNFKNLKDLSKKKFSSSTYHKKKDINKVTELNTKKNIKVSKLWNLIKATKFLKHGYYIKSGQNKYFIRSIIKKV